MKRTRVGRLGYANVVASLALFVALGGSSYAAIAITGRDVVDGSLTGADVRAASLTGRQIRPHSLLALDFRAGQLRRGPRGARGRRGPAGTPDGYSKVQADQRFLQAGGKAADASALGGIAPDGFVQGGGAITFRQSLLDGNQSNTSWLTVNGAAHLEVSCAPGGHGTVRLVDDSSNLVHAFADSVVYKSADMSEYELHGTGDGVDVLVATFDAQETLQVLTGSASSSDLTTIVISALSDANGGCRFVGHAVHSSSSVPLA